MKQISSNNFGLLIAYLVPGLICLWGLSFHSATVASWLGGAAAGPTVGGFLYLTLGSVAAGLFVSTVRWLVLDRLHHATGVPRRAWDYARLPEHLPAVEFLIANQYRYYQFYGNTFTAIGLSYAGVAISEGWPPAELSAAVGLAELVLFLGSRDTLKNYYLRVGAFLAGAEHSAAEREMARVEWQKRPNENPEKNLAEPLYTPQPVRYKGIALLGYNLFSRRKETRVRPARAGTDNPKLTRER